MSQISITLINPRGRVVEVEEYKAQGLRDQGWRTIVNPKEDYYPQYDQSLGHVKDDGTNNNTRVIEDLGGNKLGIHVC